MNMKVLHLLKWDVKFFLQYQIIMVAAVIAVLYSLILQLLPANSDVFLILIIFSDPTFLGFLFIGVIILYEKSANTIQALSVTPVGLTTYILSKAVVLTLIAMLTAVIISISGKGLHFNVFFLMLAVVLSSLLFVFLGMVGVSRVKTFNQYILIIPVFFAPAVIPLLELLDFFTSPLFYIVPTKASLLLFEASYRDIALAELMYAISYLVVWIFFSYRWAYKSLLLTWKNSSL